MDCKADLEWLARAARAAPSSENSQPWHIGTDADSLQLSYHPQAGHDPFGPTAHGTLLSVGAVAENLTQFCPGSLQWNPVLDGQPYFRFTPAGSACALGGQHPLFQRHTNRYAYSTQPPDDALIEGLQNFRQGSARLTLLQEAAGLQRMGHAVNVCCQARFRSQELHELLMQSLRFSRQEVGKGDGLDIRTIDLSLGEILFTKAIRHWRVMRILNGLQAYRFMSFVEQRTLANSGMLVVIAGEHSTQGTLEAGRLMQRTWIHLNQQGWAVHPFYVITDQQSRLEQGKLDGLAWKAQTAAAIQWAGDTSGLQPGERLHLLLRVGKPLRQAVRSLRRTG